jgi:hypothetical protein
MIKSTLLSVSCVLFLLAAVFAHAATDVQCPWDPGDPGDELNLWEVINNMAGTSLSSCDDLDALEIEGDWWWRDWTGYIHVAARYADYTQALYWETVPDPADGSLIFAIAGTPEPPVYFSAGGASFYLKDDTTGGTWYSRDDGNPPLNADGKSHMVTYRVANDTFVCAFEDVHNLGDHDYNDLVFMIQYAAPTCIPALINIPNQTVPAYGSFSDISLDNFVLPGDYNIANIAWNTSGGTNVSVTIDANRIAHITYNPADWTGSELIVFTAIEADSGFSYSFDEHVTFQVNPLENPVVADIPDEVTKSGFPFAEIHLDDYVSHPNPNIHDSDIHWTAIGGKKVCVNIDSDRIAHITYPDGWSGRETINFVATLNPSDSDHVTFTVTYAPPPFGTVGGIAFMLDKLDLLAPWVVLMIFITGAVASVLIWRKRRGTWL